MKEEVQQSLALEFHDHLVAKGSDDLYSEMQRSRHSKWHRYLQHLEII